MPIHNNVIFKAGVDFVEGWRGIFAQSCDVPLEQIKNIRFEELEGYKVVRATLSIPDEEVSGGDGSQA